MNKPTPGEWIAWCLGSEGYQVRLSLPHVSKEQRSLSPIADCTQREFEESAGNAEFIAVAFNSCRSINPSNPRAVAEALPELVEACASIEALVAEFMAFRPSINSEGFRICQDALGKARVALAKLEAK